MKRPHFVVLVPVKPPAVGKSRLRVPDHVRPGLATAFALDTIAAARATSAVVEVVVVTSDAGFAERCVDLGLASVPDGDGLNGSLAGAASTIRDRRPDALPVALCADLPCVTAEDLGRALTQVTADGSWFVADAEATGTTMYAAPYAGFAPRFGTGSRAAHLAGGAIELTGDLRTLRRDVDDQDALAAAQRLGLGPHSLDALAHLA